LLFVVCCLLFVVCCLLFVVCLAFAFAFVSCFELPRLKPIEIETV
jgi:hypothetical protein